MSNAPQQAVTRKRKKPPLRRQGAKRARTAGEFMVTQRIAHQIARQEARKIVSKSLEKEYYDVILGPTNVASGAGDIRALSSGITTGDTAQTRDGNDIKLVSLFVRVAVYQPTAVSSAAQQGMFRLIIFKWNRPTTPTLGNILAGGGSAMAPLGVDSHAFIEVLYDEMFPYMTVETTVSHGTPYFRKIFLDLKGKARWQTGGGTNPDHGHIYILAQSQEASAPLPEYEFYSRLRYYR